MSTYDCVLTIAGSDSSAGAGIQADLKTFAALECYGLSVITALTAQNTQGVQAIHAVPENFVKLQLESLFNDIEIMAVKIGMLHNEKIIQIIADFFAINKAILILDPVMTAKDGSLLLKKSAIAKLKKQLLPLAILVTPNIPEAELLLQCQIVNAATMEHAAKALAEMGPEAVLVKGGHLEHIESNDCLYLKATREIIWLKTPRIPTYNTHGTGCTLSAAIAAYMAKGVSVGEAVNLAKSYLSGAIQAGAPYQLGHGHGPVHHFYQVWG